MIHPDSQLSLSLAVTMSTKNRRKKKVQIGDGLTVAWRGRRSSWSRVPRSRRFQVSRFGSDPPRGLKTEGSSLAGGVANAFLSIGLAFPRFFLRRPPSLRQGKYSTEMLGLWASSSDHEAHIRSPRAGPILQFDTAVFVNKNDNY
jgi:hypothetical protein